MKAWLLHSQTGLDAMELCSEVAVPEPAPGEVRLKLHFAALNPADHYLAKKMYPAKPQFPHILGRDGAGIVDKLGEGVASVKEGDLLAILRGDAGVNKPGTLAQYICVPAELLVPVPQGWDEKQAGSAPLVYLTAYQAITQWNNIEEGSVVLATGASGGVGLASVHLGKALGCKVIGLSRSEEKAVKILSEGADLVLDPSDPELVKKVKEFTGKKGVQVAVDNIGGTLFDNLIGCLGYKGGISCVGRLAGPVPELNTAKLFFKRLRIGGVSAGDYTMESARQTWDVIVELMNKAGKRPLVDQVFKMEEAKEAFARLEKGPMGKVLVQID